MPKRLLLLIGYLFFGYSHKGFDKFASWQRAFGKGKALVAHTLATKLKR